MKRRNFAKSVIAAVGVSSLPLGVSLAIEPSVKALQTAKTLKSNEGLVLKLNQQEHPTLNKDRKQFILTYDVEGISSPLQEKIYELKFSNGENQSVFMTPVNEKQLQAVFNHRLNA